MTRRLDLDNQKTKIFKEHVKKSLRRGENVIKTIKRRTTKAKKESEWKEKQKICIGSRIDLSPFNKEIKINI